MPEWMLWVIPCLFTLVFARVITRQAFGAQRPIAEDVCPSSHRDAVPVEDVDGNLVAWLCVDPNCGRQLPGDRRLTSPE